MSPGYPVAVGEGQRYRCKPIVVSRRKGTVKNVRAKRDLGQIFGHLAGTAGDHVVVHTHQRFRSKAGIDVDQHITQVLRFRGGKVIYTGTEPLPDTFRDGAQALAERSSVAAAVGRGDRRNIAE